MTLRAVIVGRAEASAGGGGGVGGGGGGVGGFGGGAGVVGVGDGAGAAGGGGEAGRAMLAQQVEVADSIWAKFMGLMGRPPSAFGHGHTVDGLWLPDSNGIHMMFMRFPIDAVFLGRPDARGVRAVVSVQRSLPAWRGLVPFVRGANGVLELPVGSIDRTRTAVGDAVLLEGT